MCVSVKVGIATHSDLDRLHDRLLLNADLHDGAAGDRVGELARGLEADVDKVEELAVAEHDAAEHVFLAQIVAAAVASFLSTNTRQKSVHLQRFKVYVECLDE